MIENIDPRTLWTAQEDLYIENDKWWAKLRVRKDRKSDQDYYDILAGKKEKNLKKEPHYHQGVALDSNHLFLEPRDSIGEIKHKVESQLYGKTIDEKVNYKTKNEMKFDMKFEVKGSSRESKVIRFKFLDPE